MSQHLQSFQSVGGATGRSGAKCTFPRFQHKTNTTNPFCTNLLGTFGLLVKKSVSEILDHLVTFYTLGQSTMLGPDFEIFTQHTTYEGLFHRLNLVDCLTALPRKRSSARAVVVGSPDPELEPNALSLGKPTHKITLLNIFFSLVHHLSLSFFVGDISPHLVSYLCICEREIFHQLLFFKCFNASTPT